ncbi:sensor histidine kinase [Dehalococcoides mccartyi]|uniref:sensor histidine kinase n=1 Tax=Dehalococcoides mccartyi TaxID=61435 RepID=UPI0001BDC3C0|nr:ATP-binding protein [Dehalococcoides mccartyi]AQU06129.1 two-component sensor histidine kinase [Dehalococcoides mccartyi]AQU07572.1 two-component sensor histidine kinase [Dehalococcoides mccartyi]AQW62607.1 two-component sensor histidine kinase [Dehalococcoides mccartyi]AQX73399.1 two-component sensor histidine kinase [Dehalococcoides mccartyi]
MSRLSYKIFGALLLTVLLSVGLTSFAANQLTASQFRQYIIRGNNEFITSVESTLGTYYAQYQSWNNVDKILVQLLGSNGGRLVLSNAGGLILADTENKWVGHLTDEYNLSDGNTVSVSGTAAGYFYWLGSDISASGSGYGKGMHNGQNSTGNSDVTIITEPQQQLLDEMNRSIWISGALAGLAALGLGLLLANQIIRPINILNRSARQIASGKLSQRVKVNSRDELGELAESFNHMAKNLENNEQSRQRLLADIAHELRTPLTVIEGTVDGMLDGVFAADTHHLTTIKEESATLTRLIKDLRDISLAESGKLKLEMAQVDIADIVQRQARQASILAKDKSISLITDISSGSSAITGDAIRLNQITSNLLSNALRHTPTGGQITLSLKNMLYQGKPGVMVSVADTGEGIPPADLPHIFDRFYRVTTSRARSEGGSGLGLAIVKEMTEAHGGYVWAESTLGKGSTFNYWLPVSRG